MNSISITSNIFLDFTFRVRLHCVHHELYIVTLLWVHYQSNVVKLFSVKLQTSPTPSTSVTFDFGFNCAKTTTQIMNEFVLSVFDDSVHKINSMHVFILSLSKYSSSMKTTRVILTTLRCHFHPIIGREVPNNKTFNDRFLWVTTCSEQFQLCH